MSKLKVTHRTLATKREVERKMIDNLGGSHNPPTQDIYDEHFSLNYIKCIKLNN